MRQSLGCLGVSSVIAACLLTSFCAFWIPFGSLSTAEGPIFCTPPTCSWVTWGTGILAGILGVIGALLGLWRNSIKGKTSNVESALANGFALSRYIVGGLQGLLVPAMIILFLLGAGNIAGVLLVIFLVSLVGQLLILVGMFAVSPSDDETEIAGGKS